MAVLRVDAAELSFEAQDLRPARPGWRQTLILLMFDELPDDVRDHEVTVTVFFRSSQILNFLTGGCPQMTFSARCHRSRRTSRWLAARLAWTVLALGIDATCAALRGEHEHCATAWTNYTLRPGRISRR